MFIHGDGRSDCYKSEVRLCATFFLSLSRARSRKRHLRTFSCLQLTATEALLNAGMSQPSDEHLAGPQYATKVASIYSVFFFHGD